MDDRFTTESARRAADDGRLDEWIAEFLASPGSDNAALGEALTDELRVWIGPVEVRLDRLHRLAGPPGSPALTEVPEDRWRDDVSDLAERVDDGLEPTPVIASWRADHLRLEDGNHRVEALRRAGVDRVQTLIGFVDRAACEAFDLETATGCPG